MFPSRFLWPLIILNTHLHFWWNYRKRPARNLFNTWRVKFLYLQVWYIKSICTLSMHCCALLWLINGQLYPYPSGLLHWHRGNLMIAPVPVKQPWSRAAQFSFWPGDYLPLHFGLNFRNPSYIYIRACCIIYICSLYHSVHKFTINNPNLCIIGLEIFNWKYWFDNLSGHLLRPPPFCAALPWRIWFIKTHCGLVMPYGDIELGQHWIRWWFLAWQHQTITWTNVDLSSVRFSSIHLRAIS